MNDYGSPLLREYGRLRRLGWTASAAADAARIRRSWDALGGYVGSKEDRDPAPVRLIVDWSDGYEPGDCDCDQRQRCRCQHHSDLLTCDYGQPCRHLCDEMRRADREGVYVIVGQVFDAYGDHEWHTVDAVHGFIGDDWRDSGYDTDVMSVAMDAYRTERAS